MKITATDEKTDSQSLMSRKSVLAYYLYLEINAIYNWVLKNMSINKQEIMLLYSGYILFQGNLHKEKNLLLKENLVKHPEAKKKSIKICRY